jgi:hypothetical protein
MRQLEDIDPGILDQTIRRLLSRERPPDREAAIAAHLGQSAELREWVEMLAAAHAPTMLLVYSAMAIGLEIGYELGQRQP